MNTLKAQVLRLPDDVLRQIVLEADRCSKNYSLRLVSRRWRNLVDCIPGYWTTIRSPRMKKEFQLLCLRRSSLWPLHVELENLVALNEPSLAHAARWKSLCLSVTLNSRFTQFNFPPVLLPALESLQLRRLGYRLWPYDVEFIKALPQLSSLHLEQVFPLGIPEATFAHIRSLSLVLSYTGATVTIEQLLKTLRWCQQLQHLSLDVQFNEWDPPAGTRVSHVDLPHLTSIEFGEDDESQAVIAEHVNIPALARMTLKLRRHSEVPEIESRLELCPLVKRFSGRIHDFSLNIEIRPRTIREHYVFWDATESEVLDIEFNGPHSISFNSERETLRLDILAALEVKPLRHLTIGSETYTREVSLDYARFISELHHGIVSAKIYCDGDSAAFAYLTKLVIPDHWEEWIFANLTTLHLINVGRRAEGSLEALGSALNERTMPEETEWSQVKALETLHLEGWDRLRVDNCSWSLEDLVTTLRIL